MFTVLTVWNLGSFREMVLSSGLLRFILVGAIAGC